VHPARLIGERACRNCGSQLLNHCQVPGHFLPCCPGSCPGWKGHAMPHHVTVTLPDGRHPLADYRQPITHVMRRILAARAEGSDTGCAEEYELVAEWLDTSPGQACTLDQIRSGTCAHPPASCEPFTPPPYQRPVLDGLW
jgi:hypothetical protein